MPTDAPVLLFPGQGTEAVGMSRGWEDVPEWREAVETAERVSGQPLRAWMAEGPEYELRAQRSAPYAGIAHSVGVFRAHRAAGLPLPAIAAGHSLGFFSAIVAAEVVGLEDVLELVRNTEGLADERFGAGSMGMAFIIGMRGDLLREALAGHPQLALSNINGQAQFTVSGPLLALEELLGEVAPGCLRAGLLPVRQPLHGRHMLPLVAKLARRLAYVEPREPRFPLLSMSDGGFLRTGALAWKEAVSSVAKPVDWPAVAGALAGFADPWLECGYGSQLSGLTRWIDRNRLVGSLQPPPGAIPPLPC